MFADVPMYTPVSESDVRIRFPVPLGVIVRLSFDSVPIVAADPAPRFNVVAEIPRVGADVMVVRPVAERVVSSAANVIVLLPESSVNVFAPPDVIVPAPVKLRESMSSVVPSIDMFPRSASSFIVIDPVVADTSNSLKLIAVAPPLIDVREVPLRVVVPVRLNVSVCAERIDPAAPLRGDIVMFPVVLPPRVRVLFLRDWMVDVAAFNDRPLLLVVAERVAVGVPLEIPVIANLALVVDVPPTAKSKVEFDGESRFELSCQ